MLVYWRKILQLYKMLDCYDAFYITILGGDFLWLKFTQSFTNKKLTLYSLTGLLGKMHFPVPLSKNYCFQPNDFRQLFISRVWQNAGCPQTQSINVYCYNQLLGRASYSPTIRATVHTLKSTHEFERHFPHLHISCLLVMPFSVMVVAMVEMKRGIM